MKKCTGCGVEKDLGEFYANKSAKDGLTLRCKICVKKATADWQAQLIENTKIGLIYSMAKSRAKRAGVEFTIKLEDIAVPTKCPVFGTKLRFNNSGRGYSAKDDSASLDRINPNRGYVKGNVVVVSWKANRTKAGLTPREVCKLADFYKKFVQ